MTAAPRSAVAVKCTSKHTNTLNKTHSHTPNAQLQQKLENVKKQNLSAPTNMGHGVKDLPFILFDNFFKMKINTIY